MVSAFGLFKLNGGALTTTSSAGWTALPRDATADWFHFDGIYRVSAGAGVVGETETASSSILWSSALAAFKAAATAPDYQVAVTPGAQSLAATSGGSVGYAATLTALNGYSSIVTLSVSSVPGLPSGATAAFNPPTLTPRAGGASSTLTVTVPAGAPPGDYALTVKGAGADGTLRTAAVTLTVTPRPDYLLATMPSLQSVAAASGGSAVYSTTLTALSGYSSNVTMSVSSAPVLSLGFATAFLPASLAPTAGGATSMLTVTVPAGAAVGSYQLTVTGTGSDSTVHTASVTLSVSAANPIVLENQQAGSTAWNANGAGIHVGTDSAQQIKGYASASSVLPGQSLGLFVTVNQVQTYRLDVFRVGYYGGAGARLMTTVTNLAGAPQAACPMDPTTLMIVCGWTASYTLSVPTAWVSGLYLVLLTNAAGYQNYIPFVVRDGRSATYVFQAAVNTWEAYNDYPHNAGGTSLYTSPKAAKVSFDRPFAENGAIDALEYDVPLIQWFEQSGYDVTYQTDVDTHASAASLLGHKGVLLPGHTEYWSKQMYDAAEQARDHGVGLGFFGANAIYWQVRLESSAGGVPNRVLVCYKDANLDPVKDNTATVNWRDPLVNRPEQLLMGVQFSSYANWADPKAPYVVSASTNWAFAGTGVVNGTSIPGMVGYEIDRYFPTYPLPPLLQRQVLSASPFSALSGNDTANSSVYQALSGAWVFAAGTTNWAQGLVPSAGNATIRQITANVMNAFANPVTAPVDFQIATTPASGSVAATGGGVGYSTTLTALNGYNSVVTLSVTSVPPLPAGFTTAFVPGSLTPTGSGAASALTVTVPPGASPASYQLTVQGNGADGTTHASPPVTLAVTAPVDFQIATTPASGSVATTGGSVGYSTTLTALNGYNSVVTLSVTSVPPLPAGFMTAFVPGSLTPTGSGAASALTVTVPAGVSPASYQLTVQGNGADGTTHVSTPVTLTVTAPVDFQIATTPASGSVAATGGSVGYSTTLTALNGYNSVVTLSVTSVPPLPAGFTTVFVPGSLTPTGSGAASALTVTVPAGASPASYQLTVRGNGADGTTHASPPVTLAVTAPVDFQIATTPASGSVAATGGSVGYSTTLTALNGYNSIVTLSVTSVPPLPAGFTTAFVPGSLTPTGSGAASALTVAVPAGASPASYQLTVQGNGADGTTHVSTPVTLTVTAAGAPIALVQAGPFREAYATTVTLTLATASKKGTLLVATVANDGTGLFTTPAGWQKAVTSGSGSTVAEVWYYPNNAGGIASAVFRAASGVATGGEMTEWSGVSTTAPLDGKGVASAANVTTITTSTGSSVSGDLVIASFGVFRVNGGAVTLTGSAGWTGLPRDATADWFHAGSVYRIGAPAGIAGETETSTAAVYWTAAIAAFR